MKRRYDEVMDRVAITDEMRRRILSNIQSMEIKARGIRISEFKQYLSAAACFAVLLAGVLAAGHMAGLFRSDEPNVAAGNGIVETGSLEQLAAAVGFAVEEPNALPFEVETTTYVSYWNKLAEITYTGEGRTAALRKSPGTEDNSGDYNTYSAVREVHMGPLAVTLKGSGEAFTLAIWSENGYAYSIRLSEGISESDWHQLIGE